MTQKIKLSLIQTMAEMYDSALQDTGVTLLKRGACTLVLFAGIVSMGWGQTIRTDFPVSDRSATQRNDSATRTESAVRSGSVLTSSADYLTGLPAVPRQVERIAQIAPNRPLLPKTESSQSSPAPQEKMSPPIPEVSNRPQPSESQRPTFSSALPVPQVIESSHIPYVVPNEGAMGTESLEAAQERAVSMSRQLQAGNFKTESARQKIEAARGVGLPKLANTTVAMALNEEPVVTSEADLSRIMPTLGPLQVNTPVAEKEFTASVTSVTIPLYLGGRVRAMIDSATALTSALQSGEQIDELDLRLKVAETYFLVLRVRSLLQIAQEAEKTAAAHLRDANRYYETGVFTKNVVLAAEVAHSNAQQDVIKVSNAVNLAQAAYNRLLWRNLHAPVSVMDLEIPPTSGPLEPLTGMALRCRPELAALAAQSQAHMAQGRVQMANVRPQVALVGAHTYVQDRYLDPNSNFVGALGVTWVPFDGGTSRAMRESSNLESLSAAKRYEDTKTAIELQVYQCWLNEQETRTRVDVAQKATVSADENLRVVNRCFREGLVNHTEVLDAQTLRTAAWTRYAHARYDAIMATWQLRRATGNL